MTKSQKIIIDENIILLSISDVMEITGWCESTVRNMFSYDEDFPAIKKGKEYKVELSAFKNYLSKRRKSK